LFCGPPQFHAGPITNTKRRTDRFTSLSEGPEKTLTLRNDISAPRYSAEAV